MRTYGVAVLILAFVFAAGELAWSSTINFEDQPAGKMAFGAAGPAKTLTYNVGGLTETLSGGVILTNELGATDKSNVYATVGSGSLFGGPTFTNPLVVTFSQAVTNFQIDILNASIGNYTMADNAGHSVNFSLAAPEGGSVATEAFAAAGTQITILFTSPTTDFSFGIDNISFDAAPGGLHLSAPTSYVPEPVTTVPLGIGLVALCVLSARKQFQH